MGRTTGGPRSRCTQCDRPLGCLVTKDPDPKFPGNAVRFDDLGLPPEMLKHAWGCPPARDHAPVRG